MCSLTPTFSNSAPMSHLLRKMLQAAAHLRTHQPAAAAWRFAAPNDHRNVIVGQWRTILVLLLGELSIVSVHWEETNA